MKHTITFKKISDLKRVLNDCYADYETVLNYKLTDIFCNCEKINYSKLLGELDGVFPVDLFTYLTNTQLNKIIFKKEIKNQNYSSWDDLEKKAKLPPPHLANFEWRYSRKSAKSIVDSLEEDLKICCLGTPTLALELIMNNRGYNTTLLDINTPIIDAINNCYSVQSGIVCKEYNAIKKMDISLCSKFDTVLINPPWYIDYYKIFICRALELLKDDGGFIILPLFPILSRHNAIKDLIELENFIKLLGYTSCQSLGYVDFDMPFFEEKNFSDNNIPIPEYNWRNAELVKIYFTKTDKNFDLDFKIDDYMEWDRTHIFSKNKCYFINSQYINQTPIGNEFTKSVIKNLSRKSIYSKSIIFWDEKNEIILKE